VLVLALLGGLAHPRVARAAVGGRPARQTPFARGVSAFRLGSYADAEGQLTQALGSGPGAPGGPGGALRNPDWARYLRAESAFFSGHLGRAREDFQALVKERSPRFAAVAAYRFADCLWSAGDRAAAVEAYRRLPAHPPREVDAGVGRFRMALFAEEQGRLAQASKMFLAFYREFPAHPWSAEAARHLAASPGAPRSPAVPAAPGTAGPASASGGAAAPPAGPSGVSPQDRLRRAEALGRDRNWDLALEELERLPPDLPPALLTERDYQIGMTKFNMRRDYAGAAKLLLAAAPRLTGDQAASAWFHGTRALSRIDQDDAAIAGYRQVVARFPGSRFAAEAQFLSGWLDYNRGRYRESLPGLQATLDRFGHSAFADDAAWCLAFALFQLGDSAGATQAFTRYAAMPSTGMTGEEQAARVMYWRARLGAKLGDTARAEGGYREVNRRWPFTFYGVAARARLAEAGVPAIIELPAPPPAAGRDRSPPEVDARITARIDELASVGLDVEAGWELERDEKAFLDRVGDARSGGPGGGGGALGHLLEEYDSLRNFHRAYELAEARNGGALASAPAGPARVWWKAAYPLAYRDLVDRYGPPAGNPDLFLYAIMRKESGYAPWDVSSADARGLLQMIPPTSARLARSAGLDFTADDLFDPEVNVRLGALYIGALAGKFHGQIPLVAGAYNAGPKAMAKWCDQHGKQPTDEFVELIAFTQTREYAKRVVGIYARYRHLYGPSPYQLPLQVDPIYDPGGPDY
jgi:soluble lytic murein transglycosylase